MTPRLLLLALPGGALLYAASFLFRCQHRHEIADRVDGIAVLRCADCLAVRPNILAAAIPAFHRTQERPAPRATGIERMAVDEAQEDAAISAELIEIEKSERFRQARQVTVARFGRHA